MATPLEAGGLQCARAREEANGISQCQVPNLSFRGGLVGVPRGSQEREGSVAAGQQGPHRSVTVPRLLLDRPLLLASTLRLKCF